MTILAPETPTEPRALASGCAIMLLLLLVSCAQPSKVSTSLTFGTVTPGLTTITVRVKNQDVRATTPLQIAISIERKDGSGWTKPESLLHPTGFVLKKQEEQILRATFKSNGSPVRATLTVKEQESGRVLHTETYSNPT
jgi:hypothetical protein